MLIDWFTVGAQALNFIILVWLLKHFLYEPILTAIDAREKRIATELAEAVRQKSEAQQERDEFHDKNKKFDQARDALMEKAMLDVRVESERLLHEARKAADELLTKQSTGVRNKALALADQLKRLAAMEVFEIARKALADLASADLEEQLGEAFARRLRQLTPEAKAVLDAILKRPNATAIVSSRFDLGTNVRSTIRNALNESFAAEIGLSFNTSPDILCGIELTAGGQRLSWDIAEYLNTLEQKVEALLSTDATSGSTIPAPEGSPEGAPLGPVHAVVS